MEEFLIVNSKNTGTGSVLHFSALAEIMRVVHIADFLCFSPVYDILVNYTNLPLKLEYTCVLLTNITTKAKANAASQRGR